MTDQRSVLPRGSALLLARNMRRWRVKRAYTVEDLADRADIPAPTMAALELGKFEPPLELVWKIAKALAVPFSALLADHAPRGTVVLRKDKAQPMASLDRGLRSRVLLPFDETSGVEFYELSLAPKHRELSEPHAAGTTEVLFVAAGSMEIVVGREPPYIVNKGDSIVFRADLNHSYRNLSDVPAVSYLVITYADDFKALHAKAHFAARPEAPTAV